MFLPKDDPRRGRVSRAMLIRDSDRDPGWEDTGEVLIIDPALRHIWTDWADRYGTYEVLDSDWMYDIVTHERTWRAYGAKPANEEDRDIDFTPVDFLVHQEVQMIILHEVSYQKSPLLSRETRHGKGLTIQPQLLHSKPCGALDHSDGISTGWRNVVLGGSDQGVEKENHPGMLKQNKKKNSRRGGFSYANRSPRNCCSRLRHDTDTSKGLYGLCASRNFPPATIDMMDRD